MKEDITTLFLVLAPATLVLVAAYMSMKRMIEADQNRRNTELKISIRNETLKIRLHAIEQLIVLMEHFSPTELVLRNARCTATVAELQILMLDLIRREMENYLPFQLYVSINTWQLVINVRNSLVSMVHQAAAELQPDEPAINLSKKILAIVQASEPLTMDATYALRKEAKQLF